MENEITNKETLTQKIENFYKNNKKIVFLTLAVLGFVIIGFILLEKNNQNKNNLISEQYIKAGILFSIKNNEGSYKLYKDIVRSKNKFYSPLALNNIIENNLEKDNAEILKLFQLVEDLTIDKDQRDLIKLKKALYLIKISKIDDGKNLLNELVKSDSIWRSTANDILKK